MLPGASSDEHLEALIRSGKYPDRTAWLPYIHDSLRRVVRKAMHPNPTARYLSPSDLRHKLEGVRPVVSWQCPDLTQMQWVGEGAKGDAWEACVSPTRAGYRFTMRKSKDGGTFRRVGGVEEVFESAQEALKHAADAMGEAASP